jgi:hypothetical protein
MNNLYSPVALFVYNRIDHTKKTINALILNELAEYTDLYIFSDGPKKFKDVLIIDKLRTYLSEVDGFKSVTLIYSKLNKGLELSITEGISHVLSYSDRIIVLEDDIVTSSQFLNFMNDCLNFYDHDKIVGSISGYVYPIGDISDDIFRVKGSDCWGWATWKDRWAKYQSDGNFLLDQLSDYSTARDFNFNNSYNFIKLLKNSISGKNESWAIKWYASCFLENLYVLYPRRTYVINIGIDGTGTHQSNIDYVNSHLYNLRIKPTQAAINLVDGKKYIEEYFKRISIRLKIFLKLKTICRRFF